MGGWLFTAFGILSMVAIAGLGQVVANSRSESLQGHLLRFFAHTTAAYDIPDDVVEEAHRRSALYEELIAENHLLDGMVVQKSISGKPLDICDSLLFSALRYVALRKLGYESRADHAWNAITRSQDDGNWYRHPRCRNTTSRDMVLGVLAAFTQSPPGTREHILNLLHYIDKTGGYVSKGRFDISYLLSGIAEILRVFARGHGILEYSLPAPVVFGFSTIEFAALYPRPGYRSHLIALSSWIELELNAHERYAPYSENVRTAVSKLSTLTEPFTSDPLPDQRLSWIAGKLFAQEPENLFFKWLRLRTANALTPLTRHLMLTELLRMPQFPKDRLPQDCDRKADYLWQRATWEYHVKKSVCRRSFNGVDFLWMASLLLDSSHDAKTLMTAEEG